jgi:4'-phosphopantetheinyl transferase
VLRILLGQYTGCDPLGISFGYTPHGKPFLSTTGSETALKFNLSHSGGYTLYAFSHDRDVGIDVEHIRPLTDMELIAAQVFDRQERDLIARAADNQQAAVFFRLWSRKEAYVKAVGHGLSGSLCDINVVTSSIEAPETSSPAGKSCRWCVQDIACAPEYSAALASEGQPAEVCYWLWTDPAGHAY